MHCLVAWYRAVYLMCFICVLLIAVDVFKSWQLFRQRYSSLEQR